MQKVVKSAVALAVIAGAAAGASASIKSPVALQPELLGSRFAVRGTTTSIGFEAAEGYALGAIGGQNGWLDNAPNGTMEVQDGAGAGNGSPNALRLSEGPQGLGTFGIAQAPATINASGASVDTRIDDDLGANYFVRGLAVIGSSAFVSFRVEFDYQGNIWLQDPTTGTFSDTGVAWVPNQYNQLTVSYGATTVDFSYGGNPLGSTPLPTFGGFFDVVQFGQDNFQGFGNGSFSGGVPAAYFDNLTVIPAPGAMALLGLGGLVAARRRRA